MSVKINIELKADELEDAINALEATHLGYGMTGILSPGTGTGKVYDALKAAAAEGTTRRIAEEAGFEVVMWNPNDGLHHYHLDEVVEDDYLCPKCRGQMTSGVQDPEGDYDDWITQPACQRCGFVPSSARNPFAQCVPAVFNPESKKIGAMVAGNDPRTDRVSVELEPYLTPPKAGNGLTWVGFVPVTEVDRMPEESDESFNSRAIKIAREVLENKVTGMKSPYGNDWYLRAEYGQMVALPGFYFFEK